jgi:predicted HAD superfamily hydrolase
VNTSLREIIEDVTDFEVYPNPALDKIYFSRNDDGYEGEILIQDMTGRMLNVVKFYEGSKLESIDISSYPSGIYQALLKSENGQINYKKFVVL